MVDRAARGKFITFEGSEGVGKSTNLECVRALLSGHGIEVVVTREPGGTPFAEDIRDVLLAVRDESVDPLAETLLMFAARAQHLTAVIEPALERGAWVLCDRFTDATRAYQGGGRGVPADVIEALARITHGSLEPDLTLYLDAGVDVALARIGDREHDRFEREQTAFFERVRAQYLELARREPRFRVVDAEQTLEDVQADVVAIVKELLAS